MRTIEQRKQEKETKQHKREMLTALIGEEVIRRLGKPDNLLQMQVRPLWDNLYRANVFIGAYGGTISIANSYFVEADDDGNIVASTPTITKNIEVGPRK